MLYLILLASVSTSYTATIDRKTGCSISVNEDLNDPQPLLLISNIKSTSAIDSFLHPEDDDGTISFKKGEKIDLVCPGGTIVENGKNTGNSHIQATCVSGTKFSINKKNLHIKSLNCTKIPEHLAQYTGKTCAGKPREIEIGIEIESRFIRHILVCFDDVAQTTVYTVFNLTSGIGGLQVGYPRPSFGEAGFYHVGKTSLNTLYTRKTQRTTINKILGLDDSSDSVIHETDSYYFAKGHLTAKADFVFGAQQRLTFYYINAVPQWQTFNAGNWKTLETNCRTFSSTKNLDLVVYTGTHGVAKLKDTNGVEQELYLYENGKEHGLPIPEIMWKVLYHSETKAGIAFIGVNNPHVADVEQFIYCKDVCDEVDWLTWHPHDVKLGYSYCCDVKEFRKTVTTLPKFTVSKLLV